MCACFTMWLLSGIAVPTWVLYTPTTSPSGRTNYVDVDGKIWEGPESFNLSRPVVRWSLPTSPYVGDSLAGGIRWALHPDFCSALLPLFPEESSVLAQYSFLSCRELREAIAEALDTWAINHVYLHFQDVSLECEQTPGALVGDSCTLAEVYIVPGQKEESANSYAADLAAYVTNDLSHLISNPVTTSGQQIEGRGLRRSRMTVSRQICWYLDTTFCYNFHRMNQNGVDVLLVMQLTSALIYILSGLCLLYVLLRILFALLRPGEALISGRPTHAKIALDRRSTEVQMPTHYCGGTRSDSLLEYLAVMPVGLVLFAAFWMIFLPIFYLEVFMPCYECFDFQATIAHEIGHVLGFDHPDNQAELNLKATAEMGPATCLDPLSNVELTPLEEGLDSLMFSVTRHRQRNCLTSDDLEGLNFLYPTCEQKISTVQCNVSPRLSGWLRLLLAVGFPYMLVTIILLALQCCVRSFQKRKAERLETAVTELDDARLTLKRDRSRYRQKLAAVETKLTQLRSANRKKSAAPTSRGSSATRSSIFNLYGLLGPKSSGLGDVEQEHQCELEREAQGRHSAGQRSGSSCGLSRGESSQVLSGRPTALCEPVMEDDTEDAQAEEHAPSVQQLMGQQSVVSEPSCTQHLTHVFL